MTVCLESKPVEEIRNRSNNDQETPVGPLELLLSEEAFSESNPISRLDLWEREPFALSTQ